MHSDRPAAVVVGLCAHGLGIVRSLHAAGVPVHALESNPAEPGMRTGLARVHRVADIHGPALIDALLELRDRIESSGPPVLFLMNDNMVRNVAAGWPRLAGAYRLSWAGCHERVVRLLDKAVLEAHCEAVGLRYPRSAVVHGEADLAALAERFQPPFIVKPTRPMSGFKAARLSSFDELRAQVRKHGRDLPFLVQDWIPGDDRHLFFCAFYLDQGRVLAEFMGQKLRSSPPALGRTTAARAYEDPEAMALAQRFFEPLGLSGPVSLEFKQDDQGRFWVIEPTIGRTDFWLDCCIVNGVDIPAVEYCHAAGLPVPRTRQAAHAVWIDTHKDLRALLWYLRDPDGRAAGRERWAFPYLHREDPGPFLSALGRRAATVGLRAARKVLALAGV